MTIRVGPGGGLMFHSSTNGRPDALARHHAAMMNMMMRSLMHPARDGGMGVLRHSEADSDAQLEAIAARLFEASGTSRTTVSRVQFLRSLCEGESPWGVCPSWISAERGESWHVLWCSTAAAGREQSQH